MLEMSPRGLLDGHHSIGKALPSKATDEASQTVLQGLHHNAQAAINSSVARVSVLTAQMWHWALASIPSTPVKKAELKLGCHPTRQTNPDCAQLEWLVVQLIHSTDFNRVRLLKDDNVV